MESTKILEPTVLLPAAPVSRPENYNYLEILKNFLSDQMDDIFSNKVIYPRQLEIHLPADHKKPCNFKCYYCQGGLLKRALDLDEKKTLKLLEEIGPGKFEYYIFGGAYTEPLMNPFMMDFLKMAKKNEVSFGIHTNGSLLKKLETEHGFVSEMFSLMRAKDYVSVSLDAGRPESHMKTKGLKDNHFDDIMDGIRCMTESKKRNPHNPSVRVCYLLNDFNSSEEEIERIVGVARDLGVDSLRFSIPYDNYGKPFDRVRDYKWKVELPRHKIYEERLSKYVSSRPGDQTHIFYFPPENQDVDRMNFKQCIYTYYQITIAADGNVYRCSSIASPSFSFGALGEIPGSKREFESILLRSQDGAFNCQQCFSHNARCNRLALEINSAFNSRRGLWNGSPIR